MFVFERIVRIISVILAKIVQWVDTYFQNY